MTATGDLSAYRYRAGNTNKPATHEQQAAVLLGPKPVQHDPETAQLLASTSANYFADWSEYQPVVDSTYAYPVMMFRNHSGYRVDAHAAANWAVAEKALSAGNVRVIFTYSVYIPGQNATIMAGIKSLFGATCPTNRLVPVVDMESGAGFAGPGNHSAEANALAAELADYAGTPTYARSHGYANLPDFQSCWPQITAVIPKHTAAYNATNPGTFAWQYQGGNPGYPAPAGAPRSYAPFGTFIDGNVIYDTIDNIERALGITAQGSNTMFFIVQDPRSPTQWAYGETWAVGMTSQAEAAIWLTLPNCSSPTVYAPDAAHFDQMMRTVILKQSIDGASIGDAFNASLATALVPVTKAIAAITPGSTPAPTPIDTNALASALASLIKLPALPALPTYTLVPNPAAIAASVKETEES